MRLWVLAALLLPALSAQAADDCSGGPPRPAPDWRDQVIYFVMLDRFDDGDPGNNDQGAGEYDPADNSRYSGGDLAGACRRLDYIQGLGATGVWITPPVANQWWNGRQGHGGYHGYWASDFRAVDAHLGTLADYRRFADALHARGMTLVQDIVVNHTGDFFSYEAPAPAGDPAQGWVANPDSRPTPRPAQPPYSLNDPRRPEDRAAGIYHWTPPIADFTQRNQETDYALADLDDLNTENPQVRRALRADYGWWIREIGVDAFRVDTAFHVPPEFFRDFLYSTDADAPGVLNVAHATGHPDFHVFGEGFGTDRPYADRAGRKLQGYMRDDAGPLLPAMLDFPLYGSLGDVFAGSRPTAELAHRIRTSMALYADPHRMPTFVDNHDVERFLAGGGEPGLRQALLALMTLPGIPVIYYGTEQGFRDRRAAMFAGGIGSGGRDHFDAQAPLYRWLAAAIALRREHPLLSRGRPTILRDDASGAGVLAWRVDHDDAQALVLFNSADADLLVDNLQTGLPAGSRLQPLFSANGAPAPAATVDRDGRLSLRLPARSGWVWQAKTAAVSDVVEATAGDGKATLWVDPLPATPVRGALAVAGTAPPGRTFRLLVDGRIDGALAVVAAADGHWSAQVSTAGLIDPQVRHRLVAWDEASGSVATSSEFRVDPAWQPALDHADPVGDDRGPAGRTDYPLAAEWRQRRPADLRRVRASVSGGSLQLQVVLPEIVAGWNPPHGFDHVAITAFLELPDHEGGSTVLPLQHGQLPDGMRWHYRWRIGGWSSAVFAADGAGADDEGRAVAPAPTIVVDAATATITMTLPATTLGGIASLDGARLWINTWDYDDGYRPLRDEAGAHAFGGDVDDALWIDATEVLELRSGE